MIVQFCVAHIMKVNLVSITPQKYSLVCNTLCQINKIFSAVRRCKKTTLPSWKGEMVFFCPSSTVTTSRSASMPAPPRWRPASGALRPRARLPPRKAVGAAGDVRILVAAPAGSFHHHRAAADPMFPIITAAQPTLVDADAASGKPLTSSAASAIQIQFWYPGAAGGGFGSRGRLPRQEGPCHAGPRPRRGRLRVQRGVATTATASTAS